MAYRANFLTLPHEEIVMQRRWLPLLFLGLLAFHGTGPTPYTGQPLWGLVYDPLPIPHGIGGSWPQCFGFKAWHTNTGPVFLTVTALMAHAEIVKPARGTSWQPLAAFDIVKEQMVTVCFCDTVFVLTYLLHDGSAALPYLKDIS